MEKLLALLLFLLPIFAKAQLLVYTVVGDDTSTAYVTLGNGGPATAAVVSSTEGIWIDGNCNLYISDMGDDLIRKVDAETDIITSFAGTGSRGFSGDEGPATDAQISGPYGLYADAIGNVYFSDRNNYRIRKIGATTGVITTIAGGGTSLGDGGPATNAQLTDPSNVYEDSVGNFFIGDDARIRKVNRTTGIITTIAGNGTEGLLGDGGPATNAELYGPCGMMFDASGNLYIADRGNSRIRKINSVTGIITTVAGTTYGYSGDSSQATAAQISDPISIAFDYLGNLIIGDNVNDVFRRVDMSTGIITTIAGDTSICCGSTAEGAPATSTAMHPEFIYLDRAGNLLYSNYGRQIRKIINCPPALPSWSNTCGATITAVPQIPQLSDEIDLYPNPAIDELHIKTAQGAYTSFTIINSIGQTMQQQYMLQAEMNVPIAALPPGMYYIKFNGSGGSEVQRFVKLP